MDVTFDYLKKDEKRAIHHFTNQLIDVLEKRIWDIWLFGSKARGDFTSESDLDILIVLENGDWDTKDQIRFTASDVSLEYDVLLNTHILSRERWEELARHQATLWREIQRDGISLLPNQPTNQPTN